MRKNVSRSGAMGRWTCVPRLQYNQKHMVRKRHKWGRVLWRKDLLVQFQLLDGTQSLVRTPLPTQKWKGACNVESMKAMIDSGNSINLSTIMLKVCVRVGNALET